MKYAMEYLDTEGRYYLFPYDAYNLLPHPLPFVPAFEHDMYLENGYSEEDSSTFPAEKIETGYIDLWQEDHYGNRYAVKQLTYKPAPNSAWVVYNTNEWRDL